MRLRRAEEPKPKWWCPIIEDWVDGPSHQDPIGSGVTNVFCTHGERTNVNGIPADGIDVRTSESGLLKLWQAHLDSAPEEGESVPTAWRDEIGFNYTKCSHTVESIVEIDALGPNGEELGKWGMAICARCGHVSAKQCPHVKCEWKLDGRLLVCLNCGADCT